MSCYAPLRRWVLGTYTKYIKSQKCEKEIERVKLLPMDILSPWPDDTTDRTQQIPNLIVPCGKCRGCKLDNAREWTARAVLESRESDNNWFVTLTYDPESLPMVMGQDGIIRGTLRKRDMTLFLKRVRERVRYKTEQTSIRYLYCGEYGPTTGRPHYHILFFNLPLDDLRIHRITKQGQKCWRSKLIEDAWGKGISEVSEFNFATAAYVARYVMKKSITSEKDLMQSIYNVEPEFRQASTKPGLGRAYFERNKDKIYKNDELFLAAGTKTLKLHSLRYYDSLYGIEQSELMKEIKYNRRLMADLSEANKDSKTTLTKVERRLFAEELQKRREKKLIRSI